MSSISRLSKILLCLLLTLPIGVIAQQINGRVVGITDGDTFTLLNEKKEQLTIRVAEIDCPERGQPYGNRARQRLAELIFQKDVAVVVQTVDQYGRTVGRAFVGDVDVSAEMIKSGAAWAYRQYLTDEDMIKLEVDAKAAKVGLWSLPEFQKVPPWQWRRGQRPAQTDEPASEDFTCGSKNYCREMTSCAEAMHHLLVCGIASLDGDNDGTPCESMCR